MRLQCAGRGVCRDLLAAEFPAFSGQRSEDFCNLVVRFQWVPKWSIEVDLVHVVPAAFTARDISGLYEVVGDAVHGSFADADHAGNVGQPNLRVLRDAQQHMGMVGEEGPIGHARGGCSEASGHV